MDHILAIIWDGCLLIVYLIVAGTIIILFLTAALTFWPATLIFLTVSAIVWILTV